MNNEAWVQRFLRACALLALISLMSGCATSRINWDQRIGAYTFDQAVVELGPPDKDAMLTDGRRVAEWLTRRSYAYSHPTYYLDPYPYYGAPIAPMYVYSPDYFLRLTFDEDGYLQSWNRFAR